MQVAAQSTAPVEVLCRFSADHKPMVFIPNRDDMAQGRILSWVGGDAQMIGIDHYHRSQPMSAADEAIIAKRYARHFHLKADGVVIRHRLPRVAHIRPNMLAAPAPAPLASPNAPLPAGVAKPAAPVVTPVPVADVAAPVVTPTGVVIPDLSGQLAEAEQAVQAADAALKEAQERYNSVKRQADALAPLIQLAREYAEGQAKGQAPEPVKEPEQQAAAPAPAANQGGKRKPAAKTAKKAAAKRGQKRRAKPIESQPLPAAPQGQPSAG